MTKISIHGSCVSRDIFRFDKGTNFKIVNYIGRNTIISSNFPKINLDTFKDITDYKKLAWEERMICFDYKKIAVDKLVSDECDFIIIDLIDERFGIIESDKGCLTYSQVLQRSTHINELGEYKVRDVKHDTQCFYNSYKRYADFLREHFDVNKIIIHEAYPVLNYLGADGELHQFDVNEIEKVKKVCTKIRKGYELLKLFLPEAIVLSMPPNTVGYENHAWGKATVHYTDDYYIEMLNKIKTIKDTSVKNSSQSEFFDSIYPPYRSDYQTNTKLTLDKNILNQESMCANDSNNLKLDSQHRFYTDKNGYHYEFFLYKKNSSKLYVVFGGARTYNGQKRDVPYFNRWTYHTFLDGNLLIVEDPMFYKYPDLLLGWFYGSMNENGCRDGLVELIQDVKNSLSISNNNLIFYSSSGGGTVAIYMASQFKNSTAITLNPQLDFLHWNYGKEFSAITKVDLNATDKWCRNDLVSQIKSTKSSNFVICVNEESSTDMEQLNYFTQKYNCKVSSGINRFDNLIIWLYKAKALMPHTAFETREMFWPIVFLGKILKHNFDINIYKELYALLGDIWNDLWDLRTNLALEKEISISPITEELEEITIANNFQNGLTFKVVDSNYQYIKVLEQLKNETLYKVNIKISNGFIPYDIAIYDFTKRKFLTKKTIIKNNTTVLFNVNYNKINDCSLILYNGLVGNTKGNAMSIDKIEISIIAD